MKKIIRLTESDLTKLIKRIISETTMAPEPVPTGKAYIAKFAFDEGKANMTLGTKNAIIDATVELLKPSVSTIKNFINSNYKLPKIVEINVGTSHTGTAEENAQVARERRLLLDGIIKSALLKIGLRADVVEQIITLTQSDYYKPSKFDYNFYDPKKVKPDDKERFGTIRLTPITTMGLNQKALSTSSYLTQSPDIEKTRQNPDDIWNLFGLLDAGTYTTIEPDQESIYKGVMMLKTYSDIEELNDALKNARKGGLASVVNSKITNSNKLSRICNSLKAAYKRSGEPESAVDCNPLEIEFTRKEF